MRPQRFALSVGGGGRGGCGGGGGGGGGSSVGGGGSSVAGGRGISWDHPRLENRSILPFSEKG